MTPAARHAALYAAQFFAFGVMLPFLPVVLASRGLDPAEVAIVLAAGSAVRLVAGPLGGRAADVLLSARGVLMAWAAAAALAVSGFAFAAGFVAALLVYLVLSAAMAPIVPLSDALCVAAARREGFDYGRVRAWGSIAFILAALLGGQAVGRLGSEAAVGLIAAGLAATVLAASRMPREAVTPPRGGGLAGLAEPLRMPPFRLLVALSALMSGSHAFYYAFGTLHWQAAGLGAGLIGALWATGVVAEIALFFWGRGLVARIGPVGLALVAAAGGALRWAVTASTADPVLLFPAQLLHAATFGAQHLATMALLGRLAPGAGAGTAQTVHAALGPGLAMGVLTLACGPLYAAYGGAGFWAMAALCAAAVPVALMLGRATRPRA